MLKDIVEVYHLYQENKDRWEDICKQCGNCCYSRSVDEYGTVYIHYDEPCPYLDTHTKRCTVYENRFKVCKDCHKVTLKTALFEPTMPEICGYVELFRVWQKQEEDY